MTAFDEELIPSEMLSTGLNLVNTAVKLINGYMNYLKRAGKKPAICEDHSEYLTADPTDADNSFRITDNQ